MYLLPSVPVHRVTNRPIFGKFETASRVLNSRGHISKQWCSTIGSNPNRLRLLVRLRAGRARHNCGGPTRHCCGCLGPWTKARSSGDAITYATATEHMGAQDCTCAHVPAACPSLNGAREGGGLAFGVGIGGGWGQGGLMEQPLWPPE